MIVVRYFACIIKLFLFKQLQGLENHLKIAAQDSSFDIGDKWVNLEVTKWPIIECIDKPLQSDGYVRGL